MRTKSFIKQNKHKKYFKIGKLRYKNKIINKLKKRLTKIIFISILILTKFFLYIKINNDGNDKTNNLYEEDDVTLVTGLFQVENNRHKFEDYFIWLNKLFQINKPIIFFTQTFQYIKRKKTKKI